MRTLLSLAGAAVCALLLNACAAGDVTPAAVADAQQHTPEQTRNLATFDDLDYRVYSNQLWDDLGQSHAANIVVHYPDGSTTTGLPDHIDKLKPQFTFAPDTHISEHPIRLADGSYTAVQGYIEGTFTEPMNVGDGQVLQPTGKAFRLPMLTVGRWENGLMVEEWLYWDNAAFMTQIMP